MAPAREAEHGHHVHGDEDGEGADEANRHDRVARVGVQGFVISAAAEEGGAGAVQS